MKIRLIAIFLLLFASNVINAQKVKISGVVSDSDGLPLELASIHVRGGANGAITNEKGEYSISVNAGDSCTLVFSCLGYNRTQRVIPSVDGNMSLHVRLKSISMDLGEITVTANKINTTTIEYLDPKKTRLAVDPSGGSIESLIVTFAGVSASNELSSQYSVRGGNFDENIVYVNGIEIYRPLLIRSGQQEGLSFINPDMTGEVNFSAGGFEARYGDKMSSVLDVRYKKPKTLEGAVSASMLGGNVYVGSSSNKFTQVTGFRYKRGTTLLKTLDTEGDYDPTFMDLQTYMTYSFTPKTVLSILGNYAANTYNFTPDERTTSFGTLEQSQNFTVFYDGTERDAFRMLFGSATLKHDLTKNVNIGLQVSAFESKEEETYDIGGEYWLSDVTKVDGSKNEVLIGTGRFHEHTRNRLRSNVFNISQLGTFKLEKNTVLWALGYQREIINDRIKEWELRDSMGYSLPYDEDMLRVYTNLYSKNDLTSGRFSGYLQDTYKFRTETGLFSINAGIRGSYWDFNKEFIFSPRVSFGFVPAKKQNLTLRFSTGLYYQAPFYKEFRVTNTDQDGNQYISLNENIRSQRSLHFVLGGDYGFRIEDRPFKLTTELYYKKLDDLVPYTLNNVKIRYYGSNVASGYTAGLDMKFSGEFVPKTDSWISFSVMKAEQNFNGEKIPLPTDQRYNISLFYTDYFPTYDRLTLSLKAIWSDGLPYSTPNYIYKPQFRSKGYRRIDIGMSYKLLAEEDEIRERRGWNYFKNIWLGIDAFNLFDINNVSSYSWMTDIHGNQYGIPNYLTGRQLNIRLIAEF